MVWATADDIRVLTGLTVSDISDPDLASLIISAQKEVLLQINTKVVREKVEYINQTRKNEIDGSNTVYYVKNWKGKFISDYDYDLCVDTSDLILVAVNRNDSTESLVEVSYVSSAVGEFGVTTAQDNVDLYITYAYSYFNPVTPDELLRLATEYLASAYSYMRIDASQKKQVKFGNVSITNSVGDESAYSVFYNKYMDIIRQLNETAGNGAIWGESHVLI